MITNKLTGRKGTSASYLIYNNDGKYKLGNIVWDVDKTEWLTLENMCKFTINPTPTDATVTIIYNNVIYTNEIVTITPGSMVYYSVEKEGYEPQFGELLINQNTTYDIKLLSAENVKENVTLTFETIPGNANVTLEWFNANLPSHYGKLKSFGVSAVPADDVSGSYAKKCFCFVTENGAFSVVSDINEPSITREEILSATFYEGEYTSDYNSAWYYGHDDWEPAIMETAKDRINYYVGGEVVRNLRFSTLQMWKWRDGNMSGDIEGYTYTVDENGVMFIYYENELVLKIK